MVLRDLEEEVVVVVEGISPLCEVFGKVCVVRGGDGGGAAGAGAVRRVGELRGGGGRWGWCRRSRSRSGAVAAAAAGAAGGGCHGRAAAAAVAGRTPRWPPGAASGCGRWGAAHRRRGPRWTPPPAAPARTAVTSLSSFLKMS